MRIQRVSKSGGLNILKILLRLLISALFPFIQLANAGNYLNSSGSSGREAQNLRITDYEFAQGLIDFNNNMNIGEYSQFIGASIDPSEKAWWDLYTKSNCLDSNEPLSKIESIDGKVVVYITPEKPVKISIQPGRLYLDGESYSYPAPKSFKASILSIEKIVLEHIRKNQKGRSRSHVLFPRLLNRAYAQEGPPKNFAIGAASLAIMVLGIGLGVALDAFFKAGVMAAIAAAVIDLLPYILIGASVVLMAVVLKGMWNLATGQPFFGELDEVKARMAQVSDKVRHFANQGQRIYSSLESSKKATINKIADTVFSRIRAAAPLGGFFHRGFF